jgi:hypothetical protein
MLGADKMIEMDDGMKEKMLKMELIISEYIREVFEPLFMATKETNVYNGKFELLINSRSLTYKFEFQKKALKFHFYSDEAGGGTYIQFYDTATHWTIFAIKTIEDKSVGKMKDIFKSLNKEMRKLNLKVLY